MEKKNNSGMLVGILIGIVITLLVVVGLFATGTIGFKTNTNTDNGEVNNATENTSNNTSTSETEKTYIGEYTYKLDADEQGIPYEAIIDLTEDGTFYASHSSTMKRWYYGTYEINGNILKLNYKFSTPAVQNMGEKLSKTITYTINNNTITGTKNEDNLFSSNVDATLKRSSNNYNAKSDFLDSLINMYTMDKNN